MKRKNIILVSLLILSGFFAIQSCKEDEATIEVKQAFTTPVATSPEVRADGTVLFTGSTVDLKWNSVNTGGDPVSWDVYFGPGKQPALYQTGVTTNQITVPVVDGQKYYWRVEIKDRRGIVTSSEINSFIAVNGLNPKMTISLTATTDINAQMGLDYTADKFLDLQLIFLNKSDMSVVTTVDAGNASEVFKAIDEFADGDYLIVAKLVDELDFGDIKKLVTIDLFLHFEQLGMINTILEFPKVMNDVNIGGTFQTVLCEVNKVGPVYTIKKAVATYLGNLQVPQVFIGKWNGGDADDDGSPFRSHIIGSVANNTLYLDSLNLEWMFGWWGEVVIKEYPIAVNFNYNAGTLTIAQQKHLETTYNGAPQYPYYVKTVATSLKTSTFDLSGAYPVMNIYYDLIQDNKSIATICTSYGWPHKYFTATITLDPAGKKIVTTPKGQNEAIKKAIEALKNK